MKTSHELLVKITARSDGVSLAFQRAANDTKRFSDGLNRLGNKSYLGRLIADLRKVREESREAWRQMGALEKAQHRMRQAGGVVAGAAAAAWVLKEPVKKTMDFDLRLRHMANTAFSGESYERRLAGVKEMETAIHNAVRRYGGNRDDAAGALDTVIASGVLEADKAMAALPEIQKYATAFNVETERMAEIAAAGVQNMKISADNIGQMFEMSGKGGQLGGFELKDMAKWLPAQTSAAAQAGLSGQAGFARLVAMNQAAKMTAGSADEAGNNLVNLLIKFKSRDTIAALKKDFDVDLTQEYKKGLLAGKDTAQVFVETIQSIVKKDPEFQRAVKMAEEAKEKGDKSAETWANITNVMEGSAIGQVINDRQANAALGALMANQKYVEDVYQKVLNAEGVGDDNFRLIADSNSYKTQQALNEKDIAAQKAFEPFNNALGDAAKVVTNFAQSFPNAAAVTTGAGYTAAALSAAGIGGGLAIRTIRGAPVNARGLGAVQAGGSGAGQMAGNAARSVFSLKNMFGVGLLLRSESLNTGEGERMMAMRQKYAAANGLDAKRLAMGIGPEVGKQASEAINQAGQAAAQGVKQVGDSVVSQSNSVGQALIAQVNQTKIQGQINVSVTASPLLQVQTTAVGNNNTTLNVGKTNTGAK